MPRLVLPVCVALALANASAAGFSAAKCVWPKGLEREMNVNVRFHARIPATASGALTLRITGSSAYRIRRDGAFVGYGPARAPKGCFRVDEWTLEPAAQATGLEIDVAGYCCNSYYFQDQPSFLQAEIIDAGGRVILATGRGDDFRATSTERLRRTPRYSFQRTFSEVYRYGVRSERYELAERPSVNLLERLAPYPSFAQNRELRVVSSADMSPNPDRPVRDMRFIAPTRPPVQRKGFASGELEANGWKDGAYVDFSNRRPADAGTVLDLGDGRSYMLDAGLNDCGFFGMTVDVRTPGRLIFTFDEVLSGGEVDPSRLNCCNVVEWMFERPGRYAVETFEPYVWRYANLFALEGRMIVSSPFVRTYKNAQVGRAKFRCSDPAFDRIFSAARETFAQNAVDVFTDCPSRERAGWLCDSFFIARVNRLLTGTDDLERLFLQNYQIPEEFDHLPRGMVPMCYPADHCNGDFIPNWAMWLVLEVEEYLKRSGDRATIDLLRSRLQGIIDCLMDFRNECGLLEKLPRWVFVEWSASNRLVRDVNYPSNMIWAETLDAMDRLYGMPAYASEAEAVRREIRRQSWTGKWFCDNAVRGADGVLKPTGICTETCQYYAFFFRTATPDTHRELWRTLVDDFGPGRLGDDGVSLKSHPDIWPSNAFIGNYLRLECLSREGLSERILEETRDFFLYMADRTGTLWEMISPRASCSHGFASHIAVVLYRDVLGVRAVDYGRKTVMLRPPRALPLAWCEGEIPLGANEVACVAWKKDASGRPVFDVKLPEGWTCISQESGD